MLNFGKIDGVEFVPLRFIQRNRIAILFCGVTYWDQTFSDAGKRLRIKPECVINCNRLDMVERSASRPHPV